MLCLAQYTITDRTDVIIDSVAPSNPVEDQLWLNISVTPNQLMRYSNGAWVLMNNKTFVSATEPTGALPGDLWIDTSNGNQLKRREGTVWNLYQDQSIPVMQSTIENMILALTGGANIFHQNESPTLGMVQGDLWFDTNDGNKCYRYGLSGWEAANFTNVIDSIDDVANAIKNDDEIIAAVTSSDIYRTNLDGKADNDYVYGLPTQQYVVDQIADEAANRNAAINTTVAGEQARAEAAEAAIKAFTDTARQYLTFDGSGILTIKKPDSTFSVQIKGDRIALMQDSTEVAYIMDGKLNIAGKMTTGNATTGYVDIETQTNGISASWRAS